MDSIGGYNPRSTTSSSSVGSGNGGGNVEDILKRLGNVETDVSELRSQVSAISATIPHLATKADVAEVRTAVANLRADLSAEISGLRGDLSAAISALRGELSAGLSGLRAELSAGLGQARADQAASETAMIKWIIATVLASTTLAFTIAKFVH